MQGSTRSHSSKKFIRYKLTFVLDARMIISKLNIKRNAELKTKTYLNLFTGQFVSSLSVWNYVLF